MNRTFPAKREGEYAKRTHDWDHPLSLLLMILLLSVFTKDAIAQDDIKELIDAVKSAPALYRTPEAVDYFSRFGQGSSMPVQQDRDAAIAGLRSAIKLGEKGQAAKEAVGTLVEVFPRLEHVVIKRNVHYTPGNGMLEDWVQTYLVSEKNNFVFSSPFIEYASLTKCENWIEALPVTTLLSKKVGSGGKILDAVADISIILRVNAGACALARITGSDLGMKQESWRSWYYQGSSPAVREITPASQPMAGNRSIPFSDIVTGGKYKLHLITNDDLVGTVTSRDDSSLVLKNEQGIPYSFRTMLIEKYESIPGSALEPDTAQKKEALSERPEMGALGFDDLLKGALIGKMLEIRIKNGSIFKGTLAQVTDDIARINVEGSEISVSRNVIVGIRLLTR